MLTPATIKQWFNAIHHRDPTSGEYEKFASYDFGRFINVLVNHAPDVLPVRYPLDGTLKLNAGFKSAAYRSEVGIVHYGWDFNTRLDGHADGIGEPIHAAAQGIVEEVRYDPGNTYYGAVQRKSYGNFVRIRHRHNLRTIYGHLSSFGDSKGLAAGWFVTKGQVIGKSGNSGFSSGAHLHFEVQEKNALGLWLPVDPIKYLRLP